MARWGDLKIWKMFLALKSMGFGDLKIGRGNFQNCIRPFKKHHKWVQMIPNGIVDTFQPRIEFSYGLDDDIRPKLTPMQTLWDALPKKTCTWVPKDDQTVNNGKHINNELAKGTTVGTILHITYKGVGNDTST